MIQLPLRESGAGFAGLKEADAFELDQKRDGEGIIDRGEVDILRRHARQRERLLRRRFAAEIR